MTSTGYSQMKRAGNKIQMTVRLEPQVHRAVLAKANRSGIPPAVVVADAAKQKLLPKSSDDELTLERATDRILRRIGKVDALWQEEHHTLRELVAIFVRTYLNHTPAVPEGERKDASMSGRARFNRFVDLLERNLKDGISVLDTATDFSDASNPAGEEERAEPCHTQ